MSTSESDPGLTATAPPRGGRERKGGSTVDDAAAAAGPPLATLARAFFNRPADLLPPPLVAPPPLPPLSRFPFECGRERCICFARRKKTQDTMKKGERDEKTEEMGAGGGMAKRGTKHSDSEVEKLKAKHVKKISFQIYVSMHAQ